MQTTSYRLSPLAYALVMTMAGVIVAGRIVIALFALGADNETPLLAFPLSVILPALVAVILLHMPPTRSREGLLLRVATAVHMVLIIAVPPFALHLALGTPVVFLLVELFETRMPARVREPLVGWVVA